MSKLIFTLIIPLLFFGCTKLGKNVTVTGRVVNPITGQGFEGLEVQLQKTKNSLPGGYTSVKEVYTDSKGYFEINHLAGANSYHVMVQTTADQYRLGWLIDGNYQQNSQLGVTKGKKMNVDYHAVAYGNLIIHLKNENCLGPNDTLRLFLDGSTIGSDDVQIGLLTELYGCIDIVDQPVKFPMGERYYHWEIIRNGDTTVVYDTVFIEPNETTTFEIFY